jgi:hypothetical protein
VPLKLTFCFLIFTFSNLLLLSQEYLKDTLYITSIETKNVVKREQHLIKAKILNLSTDVFDSLINLNKSCIPLFSNEHKISHFTFSLTNDGMTLSVSVQEGIHANNIADLFGIFFVYNIPVLVYLNGNKNQYFQETDKNIIIKYFKLYDFNNFDISNDIFLLDDLNVISGCIDFKAKKLNYFWETCW